MAAKTLVALTSFACTVNGVEYLVRQGETIPANHPAVKDRQALFVEHDAAKPRDREVGAG